MPTEDIKQELGKTFIKNKDGEIQELKGCISVKCLNNDDNVYVNDEKGATGSFEIKVTKASITKLKKALGINTIKRKRFIKLLMGQKIQRNAAIAITNIVLATEGCYREYKIKQIIEEFNKTKHFQHK